jgi:hypothetical protein
VGGLVTLGLIPGADNAVSFAWLEGPPEAWPPRFFQGRGEARGQRRRHPAAEALDLGRREQHEHRQEEREEGRR